MHNSYSPHKKDCTQKGMHQYTDTEQPVWRLCRAHRKWTQQKFFNLGLAICFMTF